jgi:hypothetical protein
MWEIVSYWLAFLISISFSIGGFAYYTWFHTEPGKAGLGGVIGTAIALFVLFITREYGMNIYESLTKTLPDISERVRRMKELRGVTLPPRPTAPTNADLATQIDALVSAMAIDAKGHRLETIFLASATFIGTIVSGFGELAAKWITGAH